MENMKTQPCHFQFLYVELVHILFFLFLEVV